MQLAKYMLSKVGGALKYSGTSCKRPPLMSGSDGPSREMVRRLGKVSPTAIDRRRNQSGFWLGGRLSYERWSLREVPL